MIARLPDLITIQSLLIVIFLFSFFSLIGQEYAGDFNELPESNLTQALKMKSYEQDSSASAIVLYDLGEIDVVPVGTKLNYLRRVKIFDKSASNEWGNSKIYVQKLGFTRIYGFTYNLENGKIVKTQIDESQIFKASYNKEWDIYTFALPNVKEGTVIEFAWKTVVDFHTLPKWEFQLSVPVLWSEYKLNNPIVSFRSDLSSTLKVNYEAPKGRKPHRWTAANVPAFKSELFMPNDDLYRAQLFLWSYSPSWRKAVERLWAQRNFKPTVMGQDFLVPIAKEVGGGLSVAPRDRIKNIVEYVKSNVVWNEICDFLSDDPDDILERKEGTSGDINLLLASLLAKAGIKVNAVLISTRDNGHYHEDIPSFQQFNYLICQTIIGEDTLYVDATERGLRYDALPVRALNKRGLCITKDDAYWVNINPLFKNKITITADLVLQKSGILDGTLAIARDGYAAYTARQDYFKDKDKFYAASINNSWQINDKHVENEKEYEKSFNALYDLTIDTHAAVEGHIIYVNPFLALVEESNPFDGDVRQFPIEYDLLEDKTFICKITIPEGFSVKELPQSKVIATSGNGARYSFSFTQSGKQISVLTRLQVNQTYFDAEQFTSLREFYTRVIAKKAEQVVLERQ